MCSKVPNVSLAESVAQGYPWHQDFSTWHSRDALPTPDILTAFVLIDDVNACNAPLLTIPGSHGQGLVAAEGGVFDGDSYAQAKIFPDTVMELAVKGVTAQTGPPGTIVFMHSCVAHASADNVSPLRRAMYSIVYCNPLIPKTA